ncbi:MULTISPECIES: hypothetical protein [unclassified Streptomyces]|uniref:hypothetical protein n=1 Tax=unclassified Streptomyces TaxID=2593676 RepID=UPI002E32F84F|nr:hypothetical protein [Streptomyces sp. NBC_01268]
MTTTNIRRGLPPRVSTTMDLGDDHALQILDFPNGMRAVVEGGRAVEQYPSTPGKIDAPPEVGEQSSGERTGYDEAVVRDAGEQQWFKDTFCNGAQACVQGWDWAICGTVRDVGFATGIAMVGREGTRNATLFVDVWECICVGPFCLGGHECFWIENWRGAVVPGHWISVNTTAPDHKYLRWRLEGAGGDTQVSLAAKY